MSQQQSHNSGSPVWLVKRRKRINMFLKIFMVWDDFFIPRAIKKQLMKIIIHVFNLALIKKVFGEIKE